MAMAMNVVTMPQTLGTTLGSEKYYSLFGCKRCVLRSVFSTTTAPSPKFRGLIHCYYYYYYFFFFPSQHTLKNTWVLVVEFSTRFESVAWIITCSFSGTCVLAESNLAWRFESIIWTWILFGTYPYYDSWFALEWLFQGRKKTEKSSTELINSIRG